MLAFDLQPHKYAGQELTFSHLELKDIGKSWVILTDYQTGRTTTGMYLSFYDLSGHKIRHHGYLPSTPRFILHPMALDVLLPYLESQTIVNITGTVLGMALEERMAMLIQLERSLRHDPSIIKWAFFIDRIQIVNERNEEQDVIVIPENKMKALLLNDVNTYFFEDPEEVQRRRALIYGTPNGR
jgi:hypothetical protein